MVRVTCDGGDETTRVFVGTRIDLMTGDSSRILTHQKPDQVDIGRRPQIELYLLGRIGTGAPQGLFGTI